RIAQVREQCDVSLQLQGLLKIDAGNDEMRFFVRRIHVLAESRGQEIERFDELLEERDMRRLAHEVKLAHGVDAEFGDRLVHRYAGSSPASWRARRSLWARVWRSFSNFSQRPVTREKRSWLDILDRSRR